MKKKDENKTRLVRVDREVANRVEEYTKPKKQSLGGFFTLGASEKLEKEKNNKK